MKRFALVGLSILCLSLAATTSVKAGTRTEGLAKSTATEISNPASPKISQFPSSGQARTQTERLAMNTAAIVNNTANPKITPFALVSLAYQGEYRMQGIPGFGSLHSAYSSKTVTAKDLVKAAIGANQLNPDTQTDRSYLNAVNLQLLAIQN
jgi:hypothetical protein